MAGNTGDTGNTGNTGDTGNTGNSGSAGRVDLERRDGKLWLKFGTQTYEEHPMILEAGVARSVCGARSMMAAFGIPLRFPEAIHFRYPEPAHRAAYDRVFGVPLFFGSDVNAIVVDEAFMSLVWPQSRICWTRSLARRPAARTPCIHLRAGLSGGTPLSASSA